MADEGGFCDKFVCGVDKAEPRAGDMELVDMSLPVDDGVGCC